MLVDIFLVWHCLFVRVRAEVASSSSLRSDPRSSCLDFTERKFVLLVVLLDTLDQLWCDLVSPYVATVAVELTLVEACVEAGLESGGAFGRCLERAIQDHLGFSFKRFFLIAGIFLVCGRSELVWAWSIWAIFFLNTNT